jgi:hypothetical protein
MRIVLHAKQDQVYPVGVSDAAMLKDLLSTLYDALSVVVGARPAADRVGQELGGPLRAPPLAGQHTTFYTAETSVTQLDAKQGPHVLFCMSIKTKCTHWFQ